MPSNNSLSFNVIKQISMPHKMFTLHLFYGPSRYENNQMWFWFCVSIVLVHVIGTNLAKHDPKDASETNKAEADAIFANVIKNISQVNHVLQELINNYEHLQKIYKSQENLESESSDGEIDEVSKSKKYIDGQERSKTDSPATSRQPDGWGATQMIWSDNEKDEDTDDDTSDSDSEQAVNVMENITSKKPLEPQEPAKQKPAEIIFIDTHKNITKKKKRKPSLEPKLEIPTAKAPKSRHSQVSHVQTDTVNQQKHKDKKKKEKSYLNIDDPIENNIKRDNQPSDIKTTPKSNADPKRNVEKKMQSEIFSPMNIWDDIISNKPIQLQTHNEVVFEKLRKDNNDNSSKAAIKRRKETRQRSNDTKPELVVANDNQTEKAKRPLSNSSETDEDGVKEEFQANLLREAYGDACLKVVVKKCFKACKEAGKVVCERHKCKSSYKDKFKEYIKKGCIKEFRGNTTEKILEDDKDGDASEARFRASVPDEIKDITRNGYLGSCLPHLQTGFRRSGDLAEVGSETKPSHSIDPVLVPNINILRDKYERACKKVSHGKCKNACEYAYKKICEAFTCNTARKKAYKKQCSKQCKSAYNKGRNHGSSSDSDSSESSDSSGSSSSSSSASSE